MQRVCKECEEEVRTAVEERDGDGRVVIHAKLAGARGSITATPNSDALSALKGGGQPLPLSTRSFFERRLGHDFRDVRVHTDMRANRLARSLDARAFAHGRHIVFQAGEYTLGTPAGRHLLAHELTHTIQQGASPPVAGRSGAIPASPQVNADLQPSVVPGIQRVCEVTPPPPDLACPEAVSSPGPGTAIMFGTNNSTLNAADRSTLSAIAAAWHTGGGVALLRIDGFASCEGAAELNWRLSCDRALAVSTELQAPSDGSPGVPNTHLDILAQGETDQFSATSLAANRRTVITSGGAPPPGPACGLTITGPVEVDRFCAAYVPSDAAACGVFPAPNITLTVAGAAAGATPTWSIARGGARASIVGTNTGASVDIQGDAPSGAQGDVTVQVTDGTCTSTHFLTVREPTEMTAAQTPASGATFIENIITYTVLDQFGNPMGADACVDETITVCANSIPGATFVFGDAGTDAAGQVTDRLRIDSPGGIPAGLCVKLDQVLTAGGCGPLLHNTILFQPGGITLTHHDSCAAGDPCP